MNSTHQSLSQFRVCFWNRSLYFAGRFVWLLCGIFLEKGDSLKDIPHFLLMDLPLSLTWVMEARSIKSVVVTLCYKSTIFTQPNHHYFRPFDLKRTLKKEKKSFLKTPANLPRPQGCHMGHRDPGAGVRTACVAQVCSLLWSWPWAHMSQYAPFRLGTKSCFWGRGL